MRCAIKAQLAAAVILIAAFLHNEACIAQTTDTFTIDTPGLWLRAYGTKYVPPVTISIDSTTITVNGDAYVITWDERTSAQKIADGDYGQVAVYTYAGERAMSFTSEPESLQANLASLQTEVNALLRAKDLPTVRLELNEGSQRLRFVDNGGRFSSSELTVEKTFSAEDIAYGLFDVLRGNLESGNSVAWGEDYFAGYVPRLADKVDLAVEKWLVAKVDEELDLSDGTRGIDVDGVMVVAGLLRDVKNR